MPNLMYHESDLIPLSALQHYVFCPRQCGLIHLELVWEENVLTAEGRSLHERVHTDGSETRPDCKRVFGMPVRSLALGISGKCDVVLETSDGDLMPLEYKRGKPKSIDADKVQLCAQALCLEEMTGKSIGRGFLYYFRTKRRLEVLFDDGLRGLTMRTIGEVRSMMESGITPPAVYGKHCLSCSLVDICLPRQTERGKPVVDYMERMLAGNLSEDEDGVE